MKYEDFVKTTDISNHNPIFYIFGMIEETGEIAGICKRAMRGDYGLEVKNYSSIGMWDKVFRYEDVVKDLVKEVGDTHWYGTRFLQELGLDWETIEKINLEKLTKRKNTGTLMGHGDERENAKSNN